MFTKAADSTIHTHAVTHVWVFTSAFTLHFSCWNIYPHPNIDLMPQAMIFLFSCVGFLRCLHPRLSTLSRAMQFCHYGVNVWVETIVIERHLMTKMTIPNSEKTRWCIKMYQNAWFKLHSNYLIFQCAENKQSKQHTQTNKIYLLLPSCYCGARHSLRGGTNTHTQSIWLDELKLCLKKFT